MCQCQANCGVVVCESVRVCFFGVLCSPRRVCKSSLIDFERCQVGSTARYENRCRLYIRFRAINILHFLIVKLQIKIRNDCLILCVFSLFKL